VDELTGLAHAARLGTAGALDEFIAAGHRPVWRFCAALVDQQTADDLVQETFVRAVGSIRRFRGDSSALTWLLAIARHTCMDELRSRGRQVRLDQRLTANTVGAVEPDPADEIGIRQLLSELEPERRAAFVLTQVIGLTYDEAAATCACPIGTIRSRVARARDDLINLLEAPYTEQATSPEQ
jgi:RNA polymerase sigma-70 factor (ECF subfamily)